MARTPKSKAPAPPAPFTPMAPPLDESRLTKSAVAVVPEHQRFYSTKRFRGVLNVDFSPLPPANYSEYTPPTEDQIEEAAERLDTAFCRWLAPVEVRMEHWRKVARCSIVPRGKLRESPQDKVERIAKTMENRMKQLDPRTGLPT